MFEHQAACYTYCPIRAAFGAVDDHTLDGIVEVTYMTSCPVPAVIRPNPNGIYRVRLAKVATAELGEPPVKGR